MCGSRSTSRPTSYRTCPPPRCTGATWAPAESAAPQPLMGEVHNGLPEREAGGIGVPPVEDPRWRRRERHIPHRVDEDAGTRYEQPDVVDVVSDEQGLAGRRRAGQVG